MAYKHLMTAALLATTLNSAAWANESQKNRYHQTNLVANSKHYKPSSQVEKSFVNGWGIATRPAGAGGHFWVTSKNISYEYVGDVSVSQDPKLKKLHQDELKTVTLPLENPDATATGVVFIDSKDQFVITQPVKNAEIINAPAKFIFASDNGVITAWTERKKADGTFDRPTEAIKVIDDSATGSQYFGLTANHNYDRLYAADFGKNPTIKVWDGTFKPVNVIFDAPFDDNKNGKVDPGEYAPFNIQALKTPSGDNHLFVTYARTQACPQEEITKRTCVKGALFVGEEDTSKPGSGRLAEFTEEGKLVSVWKDQGKLSAPWGLAFAPASFGALSNKLLVANFGDGTIAAFDPKTKSFSKHAQNSKGKKLVIDKIWGLVFGNGASLGDSNTLYFAAGPNDEKDGIFGSLRLAK